MGYQNRSGSEKKTHYDDAICGQLFTLDWTFCTWFIRALTHISHCCMLSYIWYKSTFHYHWLFHMKAKKEARSPHQKYIAYQQWILYSIFLKYIYFISFRMATVAGVFVSDIQCKMLLSYRWKPYLYCNTWHSGRLPEVIYSRQTCIFVLR